MGKWTVTYETVMAYEVQVEADSLDEAVAKVKASMGFDKPDEITTEITGIYGGLTE